ncbi:MAG: NHL repeat-containing protein [Candidatus Eisenbacteria bacterium]|nr:NHL repeat-containing protein [Candidatus Eisenbacteria bacterium]
MTLTSDNPPRSSDPARLAPVVLAALALLTGSTRAAETGTQDRPPAARPLLVVSGLDASVPFSYPRSIAIDFLHKEIYVANTAGHRIQIFDFSGNVRGQYVHRVRTPEGDSVDGLPRGLALDGSGHLLVVDQLASYVDVLDYRGYSVGRLELPLQRGNINDGPGAVTVTRAGLILVATRGDSGRVHQFAPDFTRLGAWGVPGSEPGRLTGVMGMAVTPDGSVVIVSPTTEFAVQVFSENGRFIQGFGRHEIGEGNFSFPSGVAVTNDGRIWVTDELRQVVQVFDASGKYVGAVGSGGRAPGEFLYPSALASDGDSLLAVAERVGNRFQLFKVQ